MSLRPLRRPIGSSVNKLRNYPARKSDGGIVGNWKREAQILRISGFDATRLRGSDLIDIPRSTLLYLDVHGCNPTHGSEVPFYALSFRAADSPYTRRDTRLRGFLHYHVPVPARPLSGGLRFRLTPSLGHFASGRDLLTPSGLPWTVPFANLVRRGGIPVAQSLLRDNLVRFPDVLACYATFHGDPQPPQPVVHAVGQPWFLDLSQPCTVLVPGPHSLLRCKVYPAVAKYGAALVCFEYTGNSAAPHELVIRLLEMRSTKIALHPQFAHLPPLTPGTLLPSVTQQPTRSESQQFLPWTWNYESPPAEMAAALHALVHGPVAAGAASEGGINHPAVKLSQRKRRALERMFYSVLPSQAELEGYAGREG
ncbi:hypothetical protein R3P38DRAFT_3039427 [Favolaschia claudopus]|uniref:Uncharacterized protein n=1 Tax=Favolaschia claudopus TaxID=2862362 RepID=A0AAW0AAD2_9AGAR